MKNKALENKVEKFLNSNNALAELKKENAVFKEKLRGETQKVRELTRRENDAEARMKKAEALRKEGEDSLVHKVGELETRLKEKGGKQLEKLEKVIREQLHVIKEKEGKLGDVTAAEEESRKIIKALKKSGEELKSKLEKAEKGGSKGSQADGKKIAELEVKLASAVEKLETTNIEELGGRLGEAEEKLKGVREEKKKLMVKNGKLQEMVTQTKAQLEGSHIEVQTLEEVSKKGGEKCEALEKEVERLKKEFAGGVSDEKVKESLEKGRVELKGVREENKKMGETMVLLKEMESKRKVFGELLCAEMIKNGLKPPVFEGVGVGGGGGGGGGGSGSGSALDDIGEMSMSVDLEKSGAPGASIFELSQSSMGESESMAMSSSTIAKK